MAANDICCFLGAGILSVANKKSLDAGLSQFRMLGNVKDFSVTPTVTTSSTPNMMSRAGGELCSVQIVDNVMVKFTVTCHDIDNLALSLFGAYTQVAAAAVVNEAVLAFEGCISPLANLPDLSITPVITDAATDLITYVEGVDYAFTEGGALIILDGTSIPAPLLGVPNIHVDYTTAPQNDLQMFTASGEDLSLFFSGVNKHDNTQSLQITLYKVSLKATPLDVIKDGKTISELVFEGSVLIDTSKRGTAALSQFGNFLQGKV